MAPKPKRYLYLRQRLQDRGISTADLAVAIGKSQTYIQACLSGRRPWTSMDRILIMATLEESEDNYLRLFPPDGTARTHYPQAASWRDGKLASSGR